MLRAQFVAMSCVLEIIKQKGGDRARTVTFCNSYVQCSILLLDLFIQEIAALSVLACSVGSTLWNECVRLPCREFCYSVQSLHKHKICFNIHQCNCIKVKVKGKIHPRTGHEGPKGE